MKQLIVNADDFGYTRGVNQAIVEAWQRGVVTSTSLMANGAAFDDAVSLARQETGLDVGCHLNFVERMTNYRDAAVIKETEPKKILAGPISAH
ncbi:MAG: hypothetical protein A3F68_11880 [Acidobacteria bacterium RIFCSPLOWO2_12_FULL_54_10]|nr:MAG: hypothetical protein A3F68_11880 [Acidobacteria bacterium RIFCSPLOWO2_12_FULL_54_10]